jgi:hypothetical protein
MHPRTSWLTFIGEWCPPAAQFTVGCRQSTKQRNKQAGTMAPMDETTTQQAGVKHELHSQLQRSRAAMLSKLAGLNEYDLRRPMTPTGTNLLGLVKHLASMEYGYLGECLKRPAPETLLWVEDGSIWDGADMWATSDQSSEYVIGLYQRACAHGDQAIEELDLDSAGFVSHWPPERRDTTLGVLLIRMVAETTQHAGHADIVRELIDGKAGDDHDSFGGEAAWNQYAARIQDAADHFKQDDARSAPAREHG